MQVTLIYLTVFARQVFLEAGCLEWSAVVSVVLRDALAVVRVVTAAKDAPLPALSRLLHGLTALTLFTHTHWSVLGLIGLICSASLLFGTITNMQLKLCSIGSYIWVLVKST